MRSSTVTALRSHGKITIKLGLVFSPKNNMAPSTDNLTDLEKEIFTKISKNEIAELKTLLVANKSKIDFVDENGMTPLQHACYKGNKEIVQMLLDQVG